MVQRKLISLGISFRKDAILKLILFQEFFHGVYIIYSFTIRNGVKVMPKMIENVYLHPTATVHPTAVVSIIIFLLPYMLININLLPGELMTVHYSNYLHIL